MPTKNTRSTKGPVDHQERSFSPRVKKKAEDSSGGRPEGSTVPALVGGDHLCVTAKLDKVFGKTVLQREFLLLISPGHHL